MKTSITSVVSNYLNNNQKKPYILALSGGIDSMVLFHILYALEISIVVAHVNHNKREDSFNEYKEIERICENKNVPFEGLTLDTLQGNFHDEARQKRLDFFIDCSHKYDAQGVLLAHHSDDQLETILMRITRGSSFTGYAGIKRERLFKDILFIRPLLGVSKEDIIQYAREHNVSYFEDSSNFKDDYTRNRFRHHIIPQLKQENPNIIEKVSQYNNYMSLADDFIKKQRDIFLQKYMINEQVDLNAFNQLDDILKIKVLKYMINEKSDNTVEVTYSQYQDLLELLNNSNPNVMYNLKGDFILLKVYNQFYIGEDIVNSPVFLEINEFDEYIISNSKKFIFSDKKLNISYTDYFEVCYNETVFPLYLRTRQDGDKMSLNIGTKKVKSILIDQKIPKRIRDNLILLSDNDKVLWIPTIKKCKFQDNMKQKIFVYEVS